MSSFLSPEAMRAATGGRWLRQPSAALTIEGIALDTREPMPGKAFVALRGERFDAHDFAVDAVERGAVMLILERLPEALASRVPDHVGILEVRDTKVALSDLARAWRGELTGTRVVAITGSAGKTTTRRLVESVLATELVGSASPKSFNNDIGVPFTILSAKREHRFLVLEIGMNRPGEILALATLARPDISVITMIGRAHLEGLGSVEAIAHEKSAILEPLAVTPGGVAIIHGDSVTLGPAIAARGLRIPLRRFGCRLGEGADALDLVLTARSATPHGQAIEVNGSRRFELALPGAHNAVNALAAIAVGEAFGISEEHIREGLARVEPAAMRLERVERGGVVFFNDAYNANPDAMAASIGTFAELTVGAGRRVLLLGDMLELGDQAAALHREVGGVAASVARGTPIALVIAVGAHANETIGGLRAGGFDGESFGLATIDAEALRLIRTRLHPGDRVLLKGSRGSRMERVLDAFDPVLADRSQSG
jgi:UDP-N-acetylmuramoyl-tripeptide--D-alanyl-D-alanine ligase